VRGREEAESREGPKAYYKLKSLVVQARVEKVNSPGGLTPALILCGDARRLFYRIKSTYTPSPQEHKAQQNFSTLARHAV